MERYRYPCRGLAGGAAGRPVPHRHHIHRVRHGRLIEHWEELNLLGVLRQIGVLSDRFGPKAQ